MITDAGLTKAINTIAPTITQGELGMVNTAPTGTETALISPLAATLLSTSYTISGFEVQYSYTLNSATGNGYTFKEFGMLYSDNTLLNRTIMADIIKTSSAEINVFTNIGFKKG